MIQLPLPEAAKGNSAVSIVAAPTVLLQIYSVLSDDRKRKIYDRTGRCDEEVGGFDGMNSQELYDYFR